MHGSGAHCVVRGNADRLCAGSARGARDGHQPRHTVVKRQPGWQEGRIAIGVGHRDDGRGVASDRDVEWRERGTDRGGRGCCARDERCCRYRPVEVARRRAKGVEDGDGGRTRGLGNGRRPLRCADDLNDSRSESCRETRWQSRNRDRSGRAGCRKVEVEARASNRGHRPRLLDVRSVAHMNVERRCVRPERVVRGNGDGLR